MSIGRVRAEKLFQTLDPRMRFRKNGLTKLRVTSGILYAIVPSGATLALRVLSSISSQISKILSRDVIVS